MERFTPLYAIAYAITNSMENLRFDKEGYFYVLVFYGLFCKRNKKHIAFVYMRPALTVNGVKPARNTQFGLASDLRLGRRELNLKPDSCKQPTGKTLHPN